MAGPLADKVAIVTGASRGAGRGVALGLGEAGATVYVTGRSVTEDPSAPGTILQTAKEVDDLGGKGIAVRCDHADSSQIESLFDQVMREQGRLDILVNNVFPSVAAMWEITQNQRQNGPTPFWELPLAHWDDLFTAGLRAHYIASQLAAPIMVGQGSGLIIQIGSRGATERAFNLPYDVEKAAAHRLMIEMAIELKPKGVTSLSLWPPLVKTELVILHFASGTSTLDPSQGVSPIFVGRAAAALAADPAVIEKSGQAFRALELAKEYGFCDDQGLPIA